MEKIIKFENRKNEKIADCDLQDSTSTLCSLKQSNIYNEGMNQLGKINDELEKKLNKELLNIPDLPLAKILYLAPKIKDTALTMLHEETNNQIISTSENFWKLNYLIDIYSENVTRILPDLPLSMESESDQDENTDLPMSLDKILMKLCKNMDDVISYQNSIYDVKYNFTLNHIFYFSMALVVAAM